MTTVYWLEDPKILFDKNYITELWPNSTMTYAEKMNTLCRLIIFLTILGVLLFRKMSILIIGLIVLCVLTYMYNKKITSKGTELNSETEINNENNSLDTKENFDNMLPFKNNQSILVKDIPVNNLNPLNNHLLTDSVGTQKKVKKSKKEINNDKLLDVVRENSEKKFNITIEDNLENRFTMDRSVRNFHNIPDYDKSTLKYLTGNSSYVKDEIFVKKNQNFLQ